MLSSSVSLLELLILLFVIRIHHSQSIDKLNKPQPLQPSDLPETQVYQAYENNTVTITIPSGTDNDDDGTDTTTIQKIVAKGQVTQINNLYNDSNTVDADVSVIQSAVDRHAIREVVNILRAYNDENYDQDPDTVDGMPSYELFLDNDKIRTQDQEEQNRNAQSAVMEDGSTSTIIDNDSNSDWAKNTMKPQDSKKSRVELRQNIKNILDPHLHNVITPFVQTIYPEKCGHAREGRACTPCYSLIRRYRHGHRRSHATHHDGHSFITVVVSLSDYGKDHLGGLYVSTGFGQKQIIALQSGDAAMHTSSLLHGVKVKDFEHNPTKTERFSWILWYRDSDTCEDHSHEWFADCSKEGNPLCQQLHSTKVGNVPGIKEKDVSNQILKLNMAAAQGGAAQSAVKIARAYLHLLPSSLEYNENEARRFFNIAIDSYSPEGHYGLAHLILLSMNNEALRHLPTDSRRTKRLKQEKIQDKLKEVIQHLEAAARLGHEFSMFNLGIAHVFGYGFAKIDMDLAVQWFIESGLPEGYFLSSQQAMSVRDEKRHKDHMQKAKTLGHFTFWRKEARMRTGSGGASGVDLNLPWPVTMDGRKPPLL